jgi:hypothetical protein
VPDEAPETKSRAILRAARTRTKQMLGTSRLRGSLVVACGNPVCPVTHVDMAVDEFDFPEPEEEPSPPAQLPLIPVCPVCREPMNGVEYRFTDSIGRRGRAF